MSAQPWLCTPECRHVSASVRRDEALDRYELRLVGTDGSISVIDTFSTSEAALLAMTKIDAYEHGKDSMYREMTEGDSSDTPWGALGEALRALESILNDFVPGEDARLTAAGYNRAVEAITNAKQVLTGAREALDQPSATQVLNAILAAEDAQSQQDLIEAAREAREKGGPLPDPLAEPRHLLQEALRALKAVKNGYGGLLDKDTNRKVAEVHDQIESFAP